MKWAVETNGEGFYWWRAESVIGEFDLEFNEKHFPENAWEVYWWPPNSSEPVTIERAKNEYDAKRFVSKWLKRFAKKVAEASK